MRLAEGGFCPADGNRLAPRGEDVLLGERVGQFRIARLLGVGGMGRVYMAVHPDIGSRVAVKVLSRDCADNRDLVERFFAEARAVNVIRHENIVNVIDLATLPDGRPYIVMEYLDGAPLTTIFEQRGAMPLGSLARLCGEVLDALGAAHAKAVVHRDLKPDNIFVTPAGRAKVLDFGIAKLIPEMGGKSGPTRTGSLLGTPHYMAPEQAMAKQVDARTDIYAMGVILYEGATGHKPFVADSLFDLLRKHVDEPPSPPHYLRQDLPSIYEGLILRALEKDPAARFQSAAELSHALAAATQALPQEAWTPIGAGAGKAVRIGPPSQPTPSGSAGPVPDMGHLPTASATPIPTPSSGEMAPQAPQTRRGSRAPIWIGSTIGLVAIATAVILVMVSRSDTGTTVAATTSPAVARDGGTGTGVATATVPAAASVARDGGTGTGVATATVPAAASVPATVPATATPTVPASVPATPTVPASVPATATATPTVPASVPATAHAHAHGHVPATPKPTPTPVKPPAPPKPGRFDAFDVSGYIPAATKLARAHFPDAVLVRIDAEGVRPNGKAELTLSDDFGVLYRFVSPSKAKRPDDLPMGVEFKPTCKFYVNVTCEGVNAYPLKGWKCDEPLVGRPTCSARAVWKKAIARGAPSKNAVGELGYWADSDGHGRWAFEIGDKHSMWIEDDCRR